MKEIQRYNTGDLVQVIEAKDQSQYYTRPNIGKMGLVVSNMPSDHIDSLGSNNMYFVLVDGCYIKLHALDMILLSGVNNNEI
jgi:hypothetical protein